MTREDPASCVATRTAAVLDACAAAGRPATLVELVERTGLPKTTLHRLCWKLVELGLLDREGDGFGVGMRLYSLGSMNQRLRRMRHASAPYLLDLVATTGWMANLALLTDGRALIVEELPGGATSRPTYRAGNIQVPLHATAIGKALLSGASPDDLDTLIGDHPLPAFTGRTIVGSSLLRQQLITIRESGISFGREEFRIGVCGIAAPVLVGDRVVAAVGLVGIPSKVQLQRLVRPVQRSAEQIGRALELAGIPAVA